MNGDLIRYSRAQIQAGSKSFAFASFFFSPRQRAGAWLLYSWCRYCDDEIDQAKNREESLVRLQALERGTMAAAQSEVPLQQEQFEGLRLVMREFGIPLKYPMDLLRGMRMDVENRRYETLEELEDYCYCVAGVVGLMMCHIMGISSPKALAHAVALGSAMQMTNIARDVQDDLRLGRIYFPMQWLRERGLSAENFGGSDRSHWAALTVRLVSQAHQRYEVGREGLSYLSYRGALACAIAASVYERIGSKVLSLGSAAWNERCYVRHGEKIFIALGEAIKLSIRMSRRIWDRWTARPIETVWGE